ncbi:hypothetical protein ES703_62262 [subsurface metagenome]
MPGILLDGRTYKMKQMKRNGDSALARGGDDGIGLTKVVPFEDGNGSSFCVTEEWFEKNKKPVGIEVDTSKVPAEIKPLSKVPAEIIPLG